MRWPSSRDYNEAVQDPSFSFKDVELRVAEVTTSAHGLPIARSGGFADVYQLRSTAGKSWAVKCFTKEVSQLNRRYQAISEHLAQARATTKLPFMVDFQYLDGDLRIGSERYPILKMTWVEGKLLHEFVRERLDTPAVLEKLSVIWHKLSQNLRAAKIAHGDLQHGNVILVPTDGGVLPQLIDYDGMYVPALEGTPASEIGHANYQHPRRDDDRFHFEMDRFPLLLIYTAIRCLAVGGRKLWEKFDNGDNLLFKEADIKEPANSPLFRELWSLPDPTARALAGWVILSSRMPLREVLLLDELIGTDGKRIPTLTSKQEAEVRRLLTPTSQPMPLPDPKPLSPRKSTPVPVAKPVQASPRQTTRPAHPVKQPTAPSPLDSEESSGKGRWRWSSLTKLQKLVVGVAGFIGMNVLSCAVMILKEQGSRPARPPGGSGTFSQVADSTREKPPSVTPTPKPVEAKPFTPWRAGPVLDGHTSGVCGVAISADGKRAVSGGMDKTVFVWNLEAGHELLRLPGHTDRVRSVAISADGKRAVSGGDDKTVRVWNLDTGKELHKLEGHRGNAESVAISADGKRAISGDSFDNLVRVWDLEAGKELRKFDGHKGWVSSVAVSGDGKRAVTGGSDRTVRVWNPETGKELHKLEGHTSIVTSVAISADGRRAVSGTGGSDNSVRVWDLDTGMELHKLEGHTVHIFGVAISADGKRAFSGSEDKTIRMWNLETGKQLQKLEGHTGWVSAVAISADGKRAVSSSYDMSVRMWLSPEVPDVKATPSAPTPIVKLTANDVTLKSGETQSVNVAINRLQFLGPLTLEMNNLPPKVTAKPVTVTGFTDTAKIELTAAPDAAAGKTTVQLQASTDGLVLTEPFEITVRVIAPISTPTLRYPPLEQSRGVLSVGVSADGQFGISSGSGSEGTTARIWNLETGKELHELKGHTSTISSVAISTDGKRAITGGLFDTTVRVWNLETGKELRELKGHTASVWGVAISPDSKRAVTGGFDKTLRVWNLETGKELLQLPHPAYVMRLKVSWDGKRVVSASGKLVFVWDIDKGTELYRLQGHTEIVSGVGISADGKRAVSGGFDKTARIWNLETGKVMHTITEHISTVYDVDISADGKRTISGSSDGAIYVWNTETGKSLFRLPGKAESIRSVAISADGRRAIAGSDEKNVRVWDLPLGSEPLVAPAPVTTDWPLKIVGKWKQPATQKGLESFQEFTITGKVILSSIDNGKPEKFEGTYTLDGDTLEMVVTVSEVERKSRRTILRLTNDELVLKYGDGELQFTKVTPK
ncbi:MAG: hypothetical protein K8U57_38740 [Planctomycetes bacterium]|nr:hypothetical protein [Planctomycetota bacterium]